jgi:hypothetical protein
MAADIFSVHEEQNEMSRMFLTAFCTLKDVAETYQILPKELIAEIEYVSNSETIQRSSL